MTVAIVTDSTSDLPRHFVERFGIRVVPLTVFFGEEAFRDGIDIDAATFYRRLVTARELPRTSQPSVEAFMQAYRDALAEGASAIVSIHISSKLSGTLNSARVAAEYVSGETGARIEVIDSRNVSLGLGAVVLDAAEAADRGASVDEVIETARATIGAVYVVCVLDTLEYLQRGGRIGRASSLLGTMLRIKPLVHVEDGEVAAFDRVRTKERAVERLFEFALKHRDARRMFVAGGGNEEEVTRFRERLQEAMPEMEIIQGTIGPVVGVYTGPNVLGVCPVRRQ